MLLDMSSSLSTNDGSLSGRCSGIGFSDSVSDLPFFLFSLPICLIYFDRIKCNDNI